MTWVFDTGRPFPLSITILKVLYIAFLAKFENRIGEIRMAVSRFILFHVVIEEPMC